ncbi:MAG TPA: hypothetical protein VFA18_12485, partial [Gemmataceae bacterium]|nr:hypothetical protein [Gemmataceae bacterium]
VHGALGGCSPTAFHWDEVVPVRDTSPLPRRAHWSGLPLDINVYGLAFGNDPGVRADASPVDHVRPGLPPFLLINADNDLPTLADMANEFHDALAAAGGDVQCLRVARRNHSSVMFHAVSANDPVAQAIVSFVCQQGLRFEVTR